MYQESAARGQKKSTTPKDDAFPKPMVFVPQMSLKIKIHW
jgi:hypothetical protein